MKRLLWKNPALNGVARRPDKSLWLRYFLMFLALQLLSPAQAHACKCDFKPVRALYENPITAETAFIAKAEGTGEERLFRLVYSWTTYYSTIASPHNSKCGVKTTPGKHYLVLSLGNVENIQKRGLGFTICDSIVSELVDAEPLIEKLAARKVNDELMPNPSWFYCAENHECANEQGSCGESVGVNKKFRERFKLWATKVAPSINCLTSAAVPTGKSSCQANFCVAHSVASALNEGAEKLIKKKTVTPKPLPKKSAPSKQN